VHGVKPELLSLENQVVPVLDQIVDQLNLTVLDRSSKQFDPIGYTAIYLLSESHLSIHTWPERGYAAVDLFSCVPFKHIAVADILKKYFETGEVTDRYIERGGVLLSVERM